MFVFQSARWRQTQVEVQELLNFEVFTLSLPAPTWLCTRYLCIGLESHSYFCNLINFKIHIPSIMNPDFDKMETL